MVSRRSPLSKLRRPLCALGAVACAMLLVVCCTRKPPADTAPPAQIRAEDATPPFTACRAVESDAGTVEERFAEVLADSRGAAGMVYVFQGDSSTIADFMAELGLRDVRTAACPGQYLAAFFPGVDEELGHTLEEQLAARDGGVASIRERHFLPWVPQTGRRRPPAHVRAADAAPSPLGACHGVYSDAGTVEERFAEVLTFRRGGGGMVYVVEGDTTKIARFIADIGVHENRVAVCPDHTVVVFLPGANEDLAINFKDQLRHYDAVATVREQHFVPWLPALPKVRKRPNEE